MDAPISPKLSGDDGTAFLQFEAIPSDAENIGKLAAQEVNGWLDKADIDQPLRAELFAFYVPLRVGLYFNEIRMKELKTGYSALETENSALENELRDLRLKHDSKLMDQKAKYYPLKLLLTFFGALAAAFVAYTKIP